MSLQKLRNNPFFVTLKRFLNQTFSQQEEPRIYATTDPVPWFTIGNSQPSRNVQPDAEIRTTKKDVAFYDKLLNDTFKFHAPTPLKDSF